MTQRVFRYCEPVHFSVTSHVFPGNMIANMLISFSKWSIQAAVQGYFGVWYEAHSRHEVDTKFRKKYGDPSLEHHAELVLGVIDEEAREKAAHITDEKSTAPGRCRAGCGWFGSGTRGGFCFRCHIFSLIALQTKINFLEIVQKWSELPEKVQASHVLLVGAIN